MARRKREELTLLRQLDFGARWHPDEIVMGYPRLEELSLEFVSVAGELAFEATQAASDQAVTDVVEPFLAKVEKHRPGGVYLADGWDGALGRSLDLRVAHAAEEIQEARAAWLNSLRRQFEAWDLDGTPAEAIEARLLADIGGEFKGGRFVYGRPFAAFVAAVRGAVATVTGWGWTSTWQTAFESLMVRSDLVEAAA